MPRTRRRAHPVVLCLALAATVPGCAEESPPGTTVAEFAGPARIDHPSGLTMLRIPAGEASIGSPLDEAHRDVDEPLRVVRIERPFYMSRTEVTQAQYEDLMGANPSRFVGPDRPVDSVSRADAEAFAAALSKRFGGTWRLPTEVEWEVACRAGTTTAYHLGRVLTAVHANIRESDGGPPGAGLKDIYRRETVPVAGFEANALGLHDMHGNVWEWTSDTYNSAPSKQPDAAESRGVLRGGAWNFRTSAARSAARMAMAPDKRWDCNGFRIVLEAAPR